MISNILHFPIRINKYMYMHTLYEPYMCLQVDLMLKFLLSPFVRLKSVAEWLELVTLVHMPQITGGSRFEPRLGLGSYRWILGEFSSGVYPTVSHLLVH